MLELLEDREIEELDEVVGRRLDVDRTLEELDEMNGLAVETFCDEELDMMEEFEVVKLGAMLEVIS